MRNILILVMLLSFHTLLAQDRLSFEIRPDIGFATQELGDANLSPGFGVEGTFAYRFIPHLSAYAGWSWQQFTADESFAGANIDVEETGYTLGLQFIHPLGTLPLSYFVRGGGIYNHIELENDEGNITADSGHGLGWQAEAGVVVPLGENWRLMPGIRYRALSRDIEIGNNNTPVDLNYISIGVGFSRYF